MKQNSFLLAAGFSLAMTLTFSCTGDDGSPGKDGLDGDDGLNGIDGTNGVDGKDGIDGTNGIDGKNGTNGADGTDGVDGKNGTNGVDGTDGVDGKDGTNGKDGAQGVSCEVEEDGAYYAMVCGNEEKARWPKATCGTVAYDPAEKECNLGVLSFTFKDSRDNKVYKAVEIGSQTWMAENLNYEVGDSRCYGEGGEANVYTSGTQTRETLDESTVKSNCAKYGRLYDWATAMNACPVGWHLPDTTEWGALVEFAGGSDWAGVKLKAKSDWDNYVSKQSYNNITYESLESGNGTDDYGFAALPSGNFYNSYYFSYINRRSEWWSTTEFSESSSNTRYLSYSDQKMHYYAYNKSSYYLSVRCVMN